ncbi:Stress-related protein [Nymphaea thermarum]|nr:Stress-related protein [Nymphaea thermarum]
MAEATNRPSDMDEQEERLKRLEFVQAAATKGMACFSSLYGYAKEKSGPLRPGVETVEGTVRTVAGPVYQRVHSLPLQVLLFVDSKVDETVVKVDQQVPRIVKEAPGHVYSAAKKATGLARDLASEVKTGGVVEAAGGVAKAVYAKCEPVAEKYAVTTWHALNKLPLFLHVVHIVVPTATHLSEKYNDAVRSTTSKGYAFPAYLPLIPVERLAKVCAEGRPASSEGASDAALGAQQ